MSTTRVVDDAGPHRCGELDPRASLAGAPSRVAEALGPAEFVEAAATVGIFNGLVRVADSTGIPSDAITLERTADVRGELGFNRWGSAKSSGVAEAPA